MKTRLSGSLRPITFVFLLAVALLTGCSSDVPLEKQLVCEFPDGFLSGLDQKKHTFNYFLGLRLRLNGTRYAYIHHLNDTLSVLKTNGMEVKGSFKYWRTNRSACILINSSDPNPYSRGPERHVQVNADLSLTTFNFTDKGNKQHVYIDDHKADTTLSKSYIPVTRKGLPSVDSSIYKLTQTTYSSVVDARSRSFLNVERTTNFYFKGQKGPDFRDISSEKVDLMKNQYWYTGTLANYGSAWESLAFPVINGKAYWHYPLHDHGRIEESGFGDVYFAFIDTLRSRQGYWINGKAAPGRFNWVGAIHFQGKNDYAFVGVEANLEPKAYYLVENDRISRPYKYISVTQGYSLPSFPSAGPFKKVMIDEDSIFCYQDNRLVYQDRFTYSRDVTGVSFDLLQQPARTVLRVSCHGPTVSYFGISDQCFTEKAPAPAEWDPNNPPLDLHKYLGVSSNRTRYARIEYVYEADMSVYSRIARLYVNDTLAGTFPEDVDLFWNTNDGYVLKGKFGSMRNAFLYPHNSDSADYPRFVAKHYPQGVPGKLPDVMQQGETIKTGMVEGKTPYIYVRNHFEFPGRFIIAGESSTEVGVTDNEQFYHLLEIEPQGPNVLVVGYKVAYHSPKILDLTDAQNYVSFYSLEGNKLYLVTLDLNDWWTRLRHFFES